MHSDTIGGRRLIAAAAISAAAALVLAACGGSGSKSDATAAAAPPAKLVANVPAASLIQKGKLTICADIPVPPFEQYDEKGKLQGFEVDLGNQIAPRIGLQPVWVNSVFDTIIAALQGGKCDAIINDMFITPDREKQIRQIPYLTSGESFMVRKGNPSGIDPTNVSTLCGKTLTIELGGAEIDDAKKYSQTCKKTGKSPITILSPQKFTDSLQQLQTNHAQALFFDSPVNGYYVKLQPSQFQITGPILKDSTELGIGVGKSDTALGTALLTSLKSVQADGTYRRLLVKWGLQGNRVPAAR